MGWRMRTQQNNIEDGQGQFHGDTPWCTRQATWFSKMGVKTEGTVSMSTCVQPGPVYT